MMTCTTFGASEADIQFSDYLTDRVQRAHHARFEALKVAGLPRILAQSQHSASGQQIVETTAAQYWTRSNRLTAAC
jgi:hypothetical protein